MNRYERIKEAFKELRRRDYLARAGVSGCCGSCIAAELHNKYADKVESGEMKGEDGAPLGVWFESRYRDEPGPIFINHDGPTDEFVEVLEDHGLNVHWDGSPHMCIIVLPSTYNMLGDATDALKAAFQALDEGKDQVYVRTYSRRYYGDPIEVISDAMTVIEVYGPQRAEEKVHSEALREKKKHDRKLMLARKHLEELSEFDRQKVLQEVEA